jgi:hypothetical protein
MGESEVFTLHLRLRFLTPTNLMSSDDIWNEMSSSLGDRAHVMKLNNAEKLKENILSVCWYDFQLVVHPMLQNVFTRWETCLHAE